MRILVIGGSGYAERSRLRRLYRQRDGAVINRLDFGIDRLSAEDRAIIELRAVSGCHFELVQDSSRLCARYGLERSAERIPA